MLPSDKIVKKSTYLINMASILENKTGAAVKKTLSSFCLY